jgi:hypothetical protein
LLQLSCASLWLLKLSTDPKSNESKQSSRSNVRASGRVLVIDGESGGRIGKSLTQLKKSLDVSMEIKVEPWKAPDSWSDGWPKLAKGECARCFKYGEDFQIAKTPILCGDCKTEIGDMMMKSMFTKT